MLLPFSETEQIARIFLSTIWNWNFSLRISFKATDCMFFLLAFQTDVLEGSFLFISFFFISWSATFWFSE